MLAKRRGIKSYKSMFEERLLSFLNESESVKESGKYFDDARIEKDRKRLKWIKRFFKSKIKEIRKDLYWTENKNNLSSNEIEEIEKSFLKIEKNVSKLKMYHDCHDGIKYRGMIDLRNFFNLSVDEDYYKLIRTNCAFTSNYIECESKGDKDKFYIN